MINLSVIICIQNPEPVYLRRVLEALRNQSLPKSQWELLIVDIASKEPLASDFDISWHPNAQLFVDGKLGVANSRQRGIHKAAGDLLVFIDDNNIVDPNYLSEALRISNEWPELGVWGSGTVSLELEIEPPEYLKEYFPLLGLRDIKMARWSNVLTCLRTSMSGACFCVRAKLAAAYCQLSVQLLSRIPKLSESYLMNGEDDEICYAAYSLGLGIGVIPELRQVRIIRKAHVTENYFLKCREIKTFSHHILKYKWKAPTFIDPLSVGAVLTALRNVLLHRGFQRRMYLADFRALLKARRVILANRKTN